MPTLQRLDRLDALRGLAVVWMAVYHFFFDLNHLRLLRPVQFFLSDPFWTWQRAFIVSLFMFCAGLSVAVALHQGQTATSFWRRWAQIVACAVLVSLGSALMFPKTWISFGVLHGLAVILLLVRVLAWLAPQRRIVWLALAAVALLAPFWVRLKSLDGPFTHWMGLGTRAPRTEDWVPVLPWLGVVLLGLTAGHWLLQNRPVWLSGRLPAVLGPLAGLGRWSLSFYMVHQPVFLGLLLGGRALGWW